MQSVYDAVSTKIILIILIIRTDENL